jgi:hypothetical protein
MPKRSHSVLPLSKKVKFFKGNKKSHPESLIVRTNLPVTQEERKKKLVLFLWLHFKPQKLDYHV